MLLIRYVVLAILLILVPLVWLLWIFPATQEHWKKWWSEFIRWTFFAPAVSFFMMLTVAAIKNYPVYVDDIVKNAVDQQGNIGGVGGALYGGVGNLVVVMGLLLGGLYTANKMSITFASTAYNIAQGAGKAFGGWAGRKGIRTAGWGFAGPSQKTQRWANQGGIKGMLGKADVAVRGKLNRIPVFKDLGQVYRKPSEHKSIAASVLGGAKSGSGLFKARGEKKEKIKSQLNNLYTKKTALQQERDYLDRIPSRKVEEDERLEELKKKLIPDVDKKTKELEDSIK